MARARARWRTRKQNLAKAAEQRRAALKALREQRRRTRAERRRARAKALRAEWRDREFLENPQVQAEFSLHGQRKARLIRMRHLADIDAREKLVLRIEILIEKEDERHQRRMDILNRTLKI